MADAMNFKKAVTPPIRRPGLKPSTRIARPKFNPASVGKTGVIPTAPNRSGGSNQYNALKELYDKNRKNYNSAKVGKKWKESYIKSGNGYVKTDFGDGTRGAAIPYSVGERDQTRKTKRIAETESEGAYRKAKDAAEKAKNDAIKRRQKKK